MLKYSSGVLFSALLICLVSTGVSTLEADEINKQQSLGILEQINDIRRHYGVHELLTDTVAMTAASVHARELAGRQTLSHWGLDGSRVTERYRILGGTGLKAGENLGAGDTADSIVEAWMQSPGHRDNLLETEWFSAGVGTVHTGNGRLIIVVVFSNSRWEQSTLNIDDGSAILEGYFRLAPGVFPEEISIIVDKNKIIPFNAAFFGKQHLILRFKFPAPSEWDRNRIAAIPFSVSENGLSRNSDLIFLQSP